MREILFRGKRLDNGKWVMGFYVHHRNVAHYILDVSYGGYEDIDGGFFVPRWYAVEPSSVGQYTGLNDKNGERIFEGDVLKSRFTKSKYLVRFGTYEYGEDKELCGFYLDDGSTYVEPFGSPPEWATKLGNIHDNPELLEV